MMPTYCSFQAKYSCLITSYHTRTCMHAIISLFRMKTVADLRMLINGYKKDVSEDGSLLAPDVTNGMVLYINSNLKNAKPVEIARIVAKLAPRQDVNINALCASIKRVLQTINDMKKHLDRAWEDVVCFLKLKFDLPLNESVTKKQNPHASASGTKTTI